MDSSSSPETDKIGSAVTRGDPTMEYFAGLDVSMEGNGSRSGMVDPGVPRPASASRSTGGRHGRSIPIGPAGPGCGVWSRAVRRRTAVHSPLRGSGNSSSCRAEGCYCLWHKWVHYAFDLRSTQCSRECPSNAPSILISWSRDRHRALHRQSRGLSCTAKLFWRMSPTGQAHRNGCQQCIGSTPDRKNGHRARSERCQQQKTGGFKGLTSFDAPRGGV